MRRKCENDTEPPRLLERSIIEELETTEKLRKELKEVKKESSDKTKHVSKVKQDLLTTSDYHKKKTCEE